MTPNRRRTPCCTRCGKPRRTLQAGTSICLPCAAKGTFPVGAASKHDAEEHHRIQDRVNPVGFGRHVA